MSYTGRLFNCNVHACQTAARAARAARVTLTIFSAWLLRSAATTVLRGSQPHSESRMRCGASRSRACMPASTAAPLRPRCARELQRGRSGGFGGGGVAHGRPTHSHGCALHSRALIDAHGVALLVLRNTALPHLKAGALAAAPCSRPGLSPCSSCRARRWAAWVRSRAALRSRSTRLASRSTSARARLPM